MHLKKCVLLQWNGLEEAILPLVRENTNRVIFEDRLKRRVTTPKKKERFFNEKSAVTVSGVKDMFLPR